MLIYKQTCVTQLLYEQQQLEIERTQVRAQKEQALQMLYRMKNPRVVQKYAINRLGMKKLSLKQVRQIRQGVSPMVVPTGVLYG